MSDGVEEEQRTESFEGKFFFKLSLMRILSTNRQGWGSGYGQKPDPGLCINYWMNILANF